MLFRLILNTYLFHDIGWQVSFCSRLPLRNAVALQWVFTDLFAAVALVG